ncbi:phosphotransferase enzyme family protein [Paenibacillus contaminans]|uniref:Aminoglycoside phosphotransferase domain-containing protein n=1 Tax=Paenibacillus contaminans TaxID=450362 RepID=A0A329MKN9_9BACL|nr:phosphotransferase [Paenibacillus contaminans]RAV20491.1 hypothetical protein DQG23_16155 [Paenibacillus contaminans]
MKQLSKEQINKVLSENWGITVSGEIQNMSDWVIGFEDTRAQPYFLKRKENENKIEQELLISEVLSKERIHSSSPIATLRNKYYAQNSNEFYCLYKPLPGAIATSIDGPIAYQYGKGIALLHKALKRLDTYDHFHEMDIKHQLNTWAIPTVKSILDEKELEKFDEILAQCNENFLEKCNSLPKQLIHRDPHPGNMLLTSNEEVGFIDFEIATIGLRIFDIGYCSTGILMSDFLNNGFRNHWFTLLENLVAGYQNVERFTADEMNAFFYLLIGIQLIFIAYFHNGDQNLVRLNISGMFWIAANKDNVFKAIGS